MKTIERRLERLEAIHGGPLPPFPDLTDLTECEAETVMQAWLSYLINRPFGETPEELCKRMITELAPKEKIALAKYLRTKVE